MKPRGDKRGMIIVMVVGLLTFVAMLGATLLIVTHLDALQSRARIVRSQVGPTSEGFMSAIVGAMGGDLWIDANGRYGAAESGAAGWLQFVDWHNTANDPNGLDAWLGPYWYGLVGSSLGPVDVNGDGLDDAHLFRCAVMNSLGEEYFMAAKTTDASGLICLSTAGMSDPNFTPSPTCPISVDLLGLLGSTYYPLVHNSRCGGYNFTLTQYNTDCATRLLQPADSNYYRPFAIGEEMYLRWLKTPAPTETGRLYTLLPPAGVPMATRALLTTYTGSSVFVRRPDPNSDWPKEDFTVRIVPDVTPAKQQETYERMLAMLNEIEISGNASTRKRMAAAFVANLKAYQNSGTTDAPWDFTPKDSAGIDEAFTAYGLIPDVVITEAYACHKPDSDPNGPSDDWVWGCAIELMNPTDADINLSSPYKYRLKVGSTDIDLSGTISKNGGKLVIWNFKKGAGAAAAVNQSEVGLPASPGPGDWAKKVDLSFLDKATVRLVRVHGSDEVPVDQVSASDDLDYEITNVNSDPGKKSDIRRDDNLDRGRYNVAAYVSSSTDHKLGEGNDLAVAALDAEAKYPVPIVRSKQGVRDVGELLQLYLIGPIKDGSELRPFTVAITETSNSTLFRKDARARGRLDVAPPNINYGGYTPGEYPDVPAGCLLSEFFTLVPPDQTRQVPPSRVYGRINPNTAPAEVLAHLPFPSRIVNPTNGSSVAVSATMAAEYILAYREGRATSDGHRNYSTRSLELAANITGLRGASVSGAEKCFLTPDEVAIPLADYANTLLGWTDYSTENVSLTKHRKYLEARDAIFRGVSNVITVNTDVVIFNIRLQMGNPPKAVWYFVLVVDRGNCRMVGDVPAVVLFGEIQQGQDTN